MLRILLFFAASAAILPLSWRPLKDVRTHGFYRFFAFELLLGLILWNAPLWWRAHYHGGNWLPTFSE